jgi:hypothetical protein
MKQQQIVIYKQKIVDLPIENGDVQYKLPFSHGFPMVFPLTMVMFHSFLYIQCQQSSQRQ